MARTRRFRLAGAIGAVVVLAATGFAATQPSSEDRHSAAAAPAVLLVTPEHGIVQIDDYATGQSDHLKFTAFLDDVCTNANPRQPAETHMPWGQFPAREFLITGPYTLCNGVKLLGAGENVGANGLGISNESTPAGRVKVNPPGDGINENSVFHHVNQLSNITFSGIAWWCTGAPNPCQFWSQPNVNGSLYPANFDNQMWYGFTHIFGSTTSDGSAIDSAAALTGVTFTGNSTITGQIGTAFVVVGSDSQFFMDGWLNYNSPATGTMDGDGRPMLWFHNITNFQFGFMYLTVEADWLGMKLTASDALRIGNSFHGGIYEGRNVSNPATRPVIAIDGGGYSFHGITVRKVDDVATVPGAITHDDGQAVFLAPHFDKCGECGSTALPLVYQTDKGGTTDPILQVFRPITDTATGTSFVNVRWLTGATTQVIMLNQAPPP